MQKHIPKKADKTEKAKNKNFIFENICLMMLKQQISKIYQLIQNN